MSPATKYPKISTRLTPSFFEEGVLLKKNSSCDVDAFVELRWRPSDAIDTPLFTLDPRMINSWSKEIQKSFLAEFGRHF